MIEIIEPKQFKTIPWKNGLGETTELAINNGGKLDNFDWRLSIASVINDGVFSDFCGYQRNLVLIAGQGLMLQHDDKITDNLVNLLDIASFDGGCKTFGKLTDGVIKDFNIITNKQKILPQINCYVDAQQVAVQLEQLNTYFAYSLTAIMQVETNQQEKQVQVAVPQGHLVKISVADGLQVKDESTVKISGNNMILIQLKQQQEASTI